MTARVDSEAARLDAGEPDGGIPDVPPELLRAFYPRSPLRILVGILSPWVVLAGTLALAFWKHHPAIYAAAFVLIGWRQYALLKLTHEASHYLFSGRKRWNDALANVLCSFPIGLSVQRYRTLHLAHHRHLGTAKDPDLSYYRVVATPGRLAAVALLGLTGVQGLSSFFLYYVPGLARLLHRDLEIPDRGGGEEKGSVADTFGIALTQAALFGLFWVVGHPFLYPILWVGPLFTVLPTLNRLRTIAEHTPDAKPSPTVPDIGACTRTTMGWRLTRAVLAPLNFSYHFEHHLLPGVPFHQLPKLHRLLVDRGFFKGRELLVSSGYGGGLAELCRKHRAVAPDVDVGDSAAAGS